MPLTSKLNTGEQIGDFDLVFFRIGDRYPILRYIFSRNAMSKNVKRHAIRWLPRDHDGDHNVCSCDLEITFPLFPQMETRIITRFNGLRRNIGEMFAEARAYVLSNYYLLRNPIGVQVARMPFSSHLYLNYMREYYTPSSQIAIRPPFRTPNKVDVSVDPKVTVWKSLQNTLERDYWQQVCPIFNVVKEGILEREEKEKPKILSLQSMIVKRLSWVDTVYGTWAGLKRTVHSKEYMTPAKVLKLYSDFCVESSLRTPEMQQVFKYVPSAITHLYRAMNIHENLGTLVPNLDVRDYVLKLRMKSSGGIMPGPYRKAKYFGDDVVIMSTGKKIHIVEQGARKAHEIMHEIRTNPSATIKAMHSVIKIKDEFRYGQFKTFEELLNMQMKMREFFIPDLPHTIISMIINEKRMLFERNNVIRIGHKWWHGGAYFLYKYLCGDMEDFMWIDGDIVSLDKHIQDWMLVLYGVGVTPYYKWDSMNQQQREFFERLIIHWATNMSAKLVCHVGGFWRFMNGQMYSGGKETSHGGSWIMALIFYLYCEHIKSQHPQYATVIDQLMLMNFIMIVVYGDDHIWGAPRFLYPIMNHRTWRDFLKTYMGMELRDAHTYFSLLSIPDDTGRLRVRGPRFLKRHFIRNFDSQYAPILPYKEIDESMCKFFTTEFDTPAEMATVAIGHAWDHMGTNIHAHRIISSAYQAFLALNPLTPREMIHLFKKNMAKPKMQRLMKKMSLNEADFMTFPTLHELKERHVVDAGKASYRVGIDNIDSYQDTIYEFDNIDWASMLFDS